MARKTAMMNGTYSWKSDMGNSFLSSLVSNIKIVNDSTLSYYLKFFHSLTENVSGIISVDFFLC